MSGFFSPSLGPTLNVTTVNQFFCSSLHCVEKIRQLQKGSQRKWKKKCLYSVRKSIKMHIDVYKRYFFLFLAIPWNPKIRVCVEENYNVMTYVIFKYKIWSESGRKYNSDMPFSMRIRGEREVWSHHLHFGRHENLPLYKIIMFCTVLVAYPYGIHCDVHVYRLKIL